MAHIYDKTEKTKKKIAPRAPRRQTARRTAKPKKRKLALVLSGGGMRCVYGVGVLTALVEEYHFTEPDILIAASGSAGGAAYYLSGQYRDTVSVWLSLLPGKRFISFGRRTVLDIDYIIDEIFKKRFPLDLKVLARSKTKFFLAATRVTDGETVFLRPPRNKDIYEYLRATKAVPLAYNKKVSINGKEYIDGDFGSNTGNLVRTALAKGATHVLIVENNPGFKESWMRKIVLEGLYYEKRIAGEAGYARAVLREMAQNETFKKTRATIVTLAPSNSLPLSALSRKKLSLRKGFNLGYADAVNSKELRTLLA